MQNTERLKFEQLLPGTFFLDLADLQGAERYLRSKAVLRSEESVRSLTKAGEGNMNCTLRLQTGSRSLILKQSRPWVEKYPSIPAPLGRTSQEATFYDLVSRHDQIAAWLPRVFFYDPGSSLIVLEDLGSQGDLTTIYAGEKLSSASLLHLATMLVDLHKQTWRPEERTLLRNREMRSLNHAHIFVIPFQTENGLDLDRYTKGLANVSETIKTDAALVECIHELGAVLYLKDGPCLLHGDFYPGSLIRSAIGFKLIDPEFGFFGKPEYDVGVMLGHLILASQPTESVDLFLNHYCNQLDCDRHLAFQMAGVEMLRRLLGYAQLPLNLGLSAKEELVAHATKLVRGPQKKS